MSEERLPSREEAHLWDCAVLSQVSSYLLQLNWPLDAAFRNDDFTKTGAASFSPFNGADDLIHIVLYHSLGNVPGPKVARILAFSSKNLSVGFGQN